MAKGTGLPGSDGLTSWRQRLEVAIIVRLDRFFPRPRITLHTEEAAKKPRPELEEEEFTRAWEGFACLRKWTPFKHGVVLDLACGQGIKTTSYGASSLEVRLVVGVDVDAKALKRRREFTHGHGAGKVAFVMADAGALPLKDQRVNIVISENAFEHVSHPHAALHEVARVLKDQGILSLRFFPLYYSPYGSHLWDYLSVQWVHVWASPGAVAAAYRKIIDDETPRLLREFAGKYDVEDIKTHVAAQIKQFTTLNKLTPRGFYRAVAATGG